MPRVFCDSCGAVHQKGDQRNCTQNRPCTRSQTAQETTGESVIMSKDDSVVTEMGELSIQEQKERTAKEVKALELEDELAELEERRAKLIAKRNARITARSEGNQDGAATILEGTSTAAGYTVVPETASGATYVDATSMGVPEDGYCSYGKDVGRSRSTVRRRRSSSSSSSRSASRRRRSKWSLKRFTVGRKDIRKSNCYELIAATGKWALGIKELGVRDYKALIEHIVFLSLRARTGEYFDTAHIEYDAAIRTLAEDIGFAAFSCANRGASVLPYGSLNIKGRRAGANNYQPRSSGQLHTKRPCYAWNGEQGCSRGEDECRFSHVCSRCNGKGHKRQACRE